MSDIKGTYPSNSLASAGTSKQLTSDAQQLTETYESEAALRESKFRLQLAVESANIGIYEMNLKNGELSCDERVRAHWGLSAGTAVDYNTFLKAVHPDDREGTQGAIDRALDPKGDGRCRVEFRVIGIHDEIERWIVGTGQVFFDNARRSGWSAQRLRSRLVNTQSNGYVRAKSDSACWPTVHLFQSG